MTKLSQNLRKLTHMCGFRAMWCCSNTLAQCYVCSDNCFPGDIRLVDPNRFSGLSCNVAETCTITATYDCNMNTRAIGASPVVMYVDSGTTTVSTRW